MRPSTVIRRSMRGCVASVLMSALLLGCAAAEEARPSATPFDAVSIEALQRALSGAAENVRKGEPLDPPPEASVGRVLWLGDEPIEVYEFSGPEDRRSAQAALLSGGTTEPGVHLWAAGHLLVRYRGGEGGTVLLLSGFLGDPLTVAKSPDEPYPPGVTAAIRALAERESVSPGQVQVVEFDSVTWDNPCLEAPRQGEQCPQGPVEGWRVQLRASGSTYEVRTDVTGAEVRIR